MKQTTWQSGFLGALSGVLGGWSACFLILTPLFVVELLIEPFVHGQYIIQMAATPRIMLGVWLPATATGLVVGFVAGLLVVNRPSFLHQWLSWGLVGSTTALIALTLALLLSGDMLVLNSLFPLLFLAFVPAFLGGLVARFVYGMLQRRFMPELQMN